MDYVCCVGGWVEGRVCREVWVLIDGGVYMWGPPTNNPPSHRPPYPHCAQPLLLVVVAGCQHPEGLLPMAGRALQQHAVPVS